MPLFMHWCSYVHYDDWPRKGISESSHVTLLFIGSVKGTFACIQMSSSSTQTRCWSCCWRCCCCRINDHTALKKYTDTKTTVVPKKIGPKMGIEAATVAWTAEMTVRLQLQRIYEWTLEAKLSAVVYLLAGALASHIRDPSYFWSPNEVYWKKLSELT